MTGNILWQDGLDLYNTITDMNLSYNLLSSGGAIDLTGSPFGTSIFKTQGAQGFNQTLATPTQEIWVSYRMRIDTPSTSDTIFGNFGSTQSASENGLELVLTYDSANGALKAWQGWKGTQIGSAAVTLATGWHWIDTHIVHNSTTGVVEVWIDEVQVMNLTGVNTTSKGTGNLTYWGLGDVYGNTSVTCSFDDIFVTDAAYGRIGESRIETAEPTSDTGPNNGTPSTGTDHYACVDEAQFNTSDYITMPNTSGDKEVYGHASIASAPTVVHAVRVLLVSEKDDAGSYTLEPLVISSGTEADGSAQQLTMSWGVQSSIFQVDPHTTAAWGYAAANSAAIGYKVP